MGNKMDIGKCNHPQHVFHFEHKKRVEKTGVSVVEVPVGLPCLCGAYKWEPDPDMRGYHGALMGFSGDPVAGKIPCVVVRDYEPRRPTLTEFDETGFTLDFSGGPEPKPPYPQPGDLTGYLNEDGE